MAISGFSARGAHAETRLAIAVALVFLAAACSTGRRPAPSTTTATDMAERLALDPSLSPVEFRWLSEDTVLVAPGVGKRKLAGFGNYLERSAKKHERARLAVWDDEAAWKASREGTTDSEEVLGHKRALYVKNTGGPSPVDHYATFGQSGEILYERDFRMYPLSATDDE